jgi:hypothetical protein
MIAITSSSCPRLSAQDHQPFLVLLPAISRHAQRALRKLRPQQREDALCEVLALAFCAYCRLVELGRQEMAYATPLARFAVAHYRQGRQVGSRFTSRDVCSTAAQRRRDFRLLSLQACGSKATSWLEMLVDTKLTPVSDRVAFRLDFEVWLDRQIRRDRQLAEYLALGHSTLEAAQEFKVSPGRISQLRRALERDWQAFQGEGT